MIKIVEAINIRNRKIRMSQIRFLLFRSFTNKYHESYVVIVRNMY